jgi:hypothetical protein
MTRAAKPHYRLRVLKFPNWHIFAGKLCWWIELDGASCNRHCEPSSAEAIRRAPR